MSDQRYVHDDYTIAWLCPLEVEQIASIAMLDHQHAPLPQPMNDPNSYILGSIQGHNVVVVGLPTTGNCSTATIVAHTRRTFPCLRFGLLVGIGGGVPTRTKAGPIRLGHVVVSEPTGEHSGAIHYENGKAESTEFRRTGALAPPPNVLLGATRRLTTLHAIAEQDPLQSHLKRIDTSRHRLRHYKCPGFEKDHLYQADYQHPDRNLSCRRCGCDESKRIVRGQKEHGQQDSSDSSTEDDGQDATRIIIHRGTIASGEKVMRNGMERDRLAKAYGVLCFEMEAAGAMNDFPCLVIRGISDYADSHKNDKWQGYAAATAAAYARELFYHIPIAAVAQLEIIGVGAILTTPGTSSTLCNTSLNDFKASTNHGVQTHTIHGGIHYYPPHELPVTQQVTVEALKDDLLQADVALRTYYESTSRLEVERLSGEILPLEKCYVNLGLIESSDGIQQERNPLFSLQKRLRPESKDSGQQVPLSDLFASRKLSTGKLISPRRIFIRGRAGIGKTSLCKKIVYEFLQRRLGDGVFDRVLWLPLRKLKQENNHVAYGWPEAIRDAFSPAPQISNWDHLTSIMSDQLLKSDFCRRTLFLLDGLDELSLERDEDGKMFRFLESVICDAQNIIITSRSQSSSLKIGKFDIDLEATGFTINQVADYIAHSIQDEQTRSNMKNFIATKPLLQGLLRIPVQLDAFCCTWSPELGDNHTQGIGSRNLSTMTTLYSAILIELSRKDLMHIGRHNQPQSLEDFDVMERLAEEHMLLEEFAFQGLLNNITDFSPRHQRLLDTHFRQSGIATPLNYKSTLQELSFLRTSDVQLHQSKKNYHFLHSTFQEFFAARHFVRHWLSNSDLCRLYLNSETSKYQETIPPAKFLHIHKYNPGLDLFWSFVTGLIQQQLRPQSVNMDGKENSSRKHGPIFAFFDELDNKPRDLLGPAHHRLLMCCLSEIALDDNQDTQNLRSKLEDLLYQWTIAEYNSVDHIILATQPEFPESILLSLLDKPDLIPCDAVLSALKTRPFVSEETLRHMSSLMDIRHPTILQLQAAAVILKNPRPDSRALVSRALRAVRLALGNRIPIVQKIAADLLERQSSLFQEDVISVQEEINALLARLQSTDKSRYMRAFAAAELKRYPSLPEQSINALFALLQDQQKDYEDGSFAVDVLEKQSLSAQVIDNLLTLLRSENEFMKSYAEDILRGRVLSKEIIATLVALLEDKNEELTVRRSATDVLRKQCLSEEVIGLLLTLLQSKDEDPAIRGFIMRTLRMQTLSERVIIKILPILDDEDIRIDALWALARQPILPKEAIDAILPLLKNEDPVLRRGAANALQRQQLLSEDAVSVLVPLLAGEDKLLRRKAAGALQMQQPLPERCVGMIIPLLTHQDLLIQQCAAEALVKQSSLSEEAVNSLIPLVRHQNSSLRFSVAKTLIGQSSLSGEAVGLLLPFLKDHDSSVRYYTITTLAQQSSLSSESISALVPLLNDRTTSVQCSVIDALEKQSFLPQRVIEALMVLLDDQSREVYDILRRHNSFYSTLNTLDLMTWQWLWSIWSSNRDYDVSCFELEDSLFLWANGTLHQISDHREQTQKLLQAINPDVEMG